MADKNRDSKKKTGLAFACWILGFLILIVVFIVKQDEIYSNLKTTRFFERLFGKTPAFIEKHEVIEKTPSNIDKDYLTVEEQSPEVSILPSALPSSVLFEEHQKDSIFDIESETKQNEQIPVSSTDLTEFADSQSEGIENSDDAFAQQSQNIDTQNEIEEKSILQKFNAKLYFVLIGGDGIVSRKEVVRVIEKNESPLTTNLNLLLGGPNQNEKSKGCRSLIPENTRLISASVRDGIAFLNFSEEFEFNRIGVDGYLAQLMQIVYTATEFNTVKSVQILIDGQKKEYLGSEGVWIGSPLSRSSF